MSAILWTALALPAAGAAQDPVISEFMASNHQTLEDSDGDSSDWIELHNPADFEIDLGGYHLTDDDGKLKKWSFPSPTSIPPLGFLIVFASEKDRKSGELHTNFKLKAEGEYLALVAPDLTIVHQYSPQYPPQSTDVSYGLSFENGSVTGFATFFMQPTPGAINGTGGPAITEHAFHPALPKDGEPVTVSARVTLAPGRTLSAAFLRYRVMYNSGIRVDLYDDGMSGDSYAGDGVFTGVIPGGVAAPGQMLRWLVRAIDDRAGEGTLPPFLRPTDSPQYFGTIIEDPGIVSALPVFHWFVKYPDQADKPAGTRSSLYHAGRFYDNLLVHIRGGSSQGFRKHPYKFDFNHGDKFHWSPVAPPVDEINVNSTYSDKAFIRQNLSFETYEIGGVRGSKSFPLRLEQNGEFFSVAIFVEEPEEELLERLGADPEGALYKMYNECTSAKSGVEKKTREWEDRSDLEALVQGIQATGDALDPFLFDHLDVPRVISYIAVTTLIHDNDHVAKNYYLYRDSDGDREWEFLPWDKDLTFGRNFTGGGGVLNDTIWADDDPMSHPLFGDRDHPKVDGPWNRLVDACHRSPRLRQMYVRRLRSLMDGLLQRNSIPEDQRHFERRCEELYSTMLPDAELDEARWGVPDWGNPLDFRAGLDQLENAYLVVRRPHLFQTHVGQGTIPPAQVNAHLSFGALERNPASGRQNEEYVEIVNENDFAVDVSGWKLGGSLEMTLAQGSVVAAHDSAFLSPDVVAFRARAESPTGGEGRLVLHPYQGTLRTGLAVTLSDSDGIVLATTEGPWMSAARFRAGASARVAVAALLPGECVAMLLSLTGNGPLDTPIGPLSLSCPLYVLAVIPADWAGVAEASITVPDDVGGVPLWLQGIAVEHKCLTNGLELMIE